MKNSKCSIRYVWYLGDHFQEEMEGYCVHFFVHETINGGKTWSGESRFIFEESGPYAKPFQQSIRLVHVAFLGSPLPFICFLASQSLGINHGPLGLPALRFLPSTQQMHSFSSCNRCTNKTCCFGTCKESLGSKNWKGVQMSCANRTHYLHTCSSDS